MNNKYTIFEKGASMYHYYMLNKPYGCVCARRDDRYPAVMDYFTELNNPCLSPVGRLDRATEGLLLITDDGVWNQEMTHPDHRKEKLMNSQLWELFLMRISINWKTAYY